MKTATSDTVPYMARTLNGIGGYTLYLRYRRMNAQKAIPWKNRGIPIPIEFNM